LHIKVAACDAWVIKVSDENFGSPFFIISYDFIGYLYSKQLIFKIDIEIVYTADPNIILIVNEEGKLKGMKPNPKATQLLPRQQGGARDVIVGPAVLCHSSLIK